MNIAIYLPLGMQWTLLWQPLCKACNYGMEQTCPPSVILINIRFQSLIMYVLIIREGPQFFTDHGILSRAAEFLCFRRILQNSVILGRTLSIYAIIWLTCTFDESSNYTKIDRLLRSLSTVFTHGTICSLCKVYLRSNWILYARTFTSWIVYMWNKSHRKAMHIAHACVASLRAFKWKPRLTHK